MHLRRLTFSVLVTLLAGFGMGGHASADEGNGATVTETSGCRDFREGVICSESRWVVKRTETPSGMFLSTAIGDTSFTYTGSDGCTWTSSQKKREHWTGMTEAHVLQVTETSNTCFGEDIDCTNRLFFLFANGEFRVYSNELDCAPVS